MELLIAVAIVVILAGVGIPVYLNFMKGSKHAEANTNLAGIKLSEESYKLANGVYKSCGPAPRAPADLATATAPNPVAWDGGFTAAADFNDIDFSVSGDVRFVYEVVAVANPTGFTAGALGNTDGDADIVLFSTTEATSPVKRASGDSVGTLKSTADDD
jgi:type II secretory pathway pseudopilin PulG